MIHALYTRNTIVNNSLWHLQTVSTSAEVVLKDKNTLLSEACKNREQIEARIKTFSSIWFLPETLKEVEEDIKQLYN
jgi:hypothetical protein